MHKPLVMVKEVTLGPNGTLQCTQTNGSACTDDQMSAVMAVGAETHSAAGEIRITKSIDKSSPM
jgi:type VI protein secretion system component Hcp